MVCYTIYEKCIARRSHYYRLPNSRSLNSINNISNNINGGSSSGMDDGEVELCPENVKTTEDILNATTFESKPAFGHKDRNHAYGTKNVGGAWL